MIKYTNNAVKFTNSNFNILVYGEDKKVQSPIELNENMKMLVDSEKEGLIPVVVENELMDILFVKVEDKKLEDAEKVRDIAGDIISKAVKELEAEKDEENIKKDVVIAGAGIFKENLDAFAEGLVLGQYKFDKYLSDKKENNVSDIILSGSEAIEGAEEIINKATVMAEYQNLARDFVNEPSNVIFPKSLARFAKEECEKNGIECEVYEKNKIIALGMHAYMAVARGSNSKPKFVVMRYRGDSSSDEVLGLVGKGITYDTGGYSIKSPGGMADMKTDMGGAASVIAAINAIAKLKLKTNVVAVCALCENAISGKAYKPGDIIGSMAGKTIEVLNTDAEGRLTLADAVYYVSEVENATRIVDVATLTGAALVISSDVATPVVGNNDEFYSELEKAAEASGEKFFRLPVFDEYKEFIKGDEADLRNTSSRRAGCITAGLFVGEFVCDKPWLHLDIAGTSVSTKKKGYKAKGATGAPVRTLVHLADK